MVLFTIHPPLLKAHTNCTVVKWHHSLLPLVLLSGLQGSDQDREDLQGRLRLAETRAEELAESLRAATSSMEQYRAMAQSLEESLDKEKQVQNKTQTACHCSNSHKTRLKNNQYLCEQLCGEQISLYHIYAPQVLI